MMGTFATRAYGLQELAQLYFPSNTPQSAAAQLRKWIKVKALADKLSEAAYRPGQKILTPRQVSIIVDHVGEP